MAKIYDVCDVNGDPVGLSYDNAADAEARADKLDAGAHVVVRDGCCVFGCDKGCRGWDVYNGGEIQRCDLCKHYEDDDEAVAHVKSCTDCLAYLGGLYLKEMEGDNG